MFKLDGYIEDKHVVKVLKALTGVVTDLHCVPVVNAEVKNGKMTAETGGTLVELFAAHVKKTKMQRVTPSVIKDFVVSHGKSEKSYSNLLRDAVAGGMLKRVPKSRGGGYEVVR